MPPFKQCKDLMMDTWHRFKSRSAHRTAKASDRRHPGAARSRRGRSILSPWRLPVFGGRLAGPASSFSGGLRLGAVTLAQGFLARSPCFYGLIETGVQGNVMVPCACAGQTGRFYSPCGSPSRRAGCRPPP